MGQRRRLCAVTPRLWLRLFAAIYGAHVGSALFISPPPKASRPTAPSELADADGGLATGCAAGGAGTNAPPPGALAGALVRRQPRAAVARLGVEGGREAEGERQEEGVKLLTSLIPTQEFSTVAWDSTGVRVNVSLQPSYAQEGSVMVR